MFDLDDARLRPLWIRLIITISCFVWATVEFVNDSVTWAVIFGGLGLIAAYRLFVTFNPPENDKS